MCLSGPALCSTQHSTLYAAGGKLTEHCHKRDQVLLSFVLMYFCVSLPVTYALRYPTKKKNRQQYLDLLLWYPLAHTHGIRGTYTASDARFHRPRCCLRGGMAPYLSTCCHPADAYHFRVVPPTLAVCMSNPGIRDMEYRYYNNPLQHHPAAIKQSGRENSFTRDY